MNREARQQEPSILVRGLIFALVFGVVLILWAIAAAHHEYAIHRAQQDSGMFDLITDLEGTPPWYPGLAFLTGSVSFAVALFSGAARLARRLRGRGPRSSSSR